MTKITAHAHPQRSGAVTIDINNDASETIAVLHVSQRSPRSAVDVNITWADLLVIRRDNKVVAEFGDDSQPDSDDEPTPELRAAANAVLVFYGIDGGNGYLGGFTNSLLETITRADSHNRRSLSLGFPELVRCADLYRNDNDGVEILRRWAARW